MSTPSNLRISRGDIWLVDFDPTQGQEIQKRRPAVVMSIRAAWRVRLHIVVPITSWQEKFSQDFWMIHLLPTAANGLERESAANAFQVKSVSENRFVIKPGNLLAAELNAITAAIVICIGFEPSTS